MSESIHIDRPPRIQPELPFDEIEVPAPPDKDEDGLMRLLQIGLPVITILGYILIAALGRGRSLALVIPMGLAVIASVAFSIWSYRREQKRRQEIEAAYNERLIELYKEMEGHHDQQRRFFSYNYPDVTIASRILQKARTEINKETRTLRTESRLWERRSSDDDFGVLRLGIGTLPSTVIYKFEDAENFDDPQVREAMKLDNDSRYVKDIPVILAVRQPREEESGEDGVADEPNRPTSTPIKHAIGLAGHQAAVYQYVRAMLVHYVVFHAPVDARLYVLATHKDEWVWTDDLPHSRNDDQNTYCCFVAEQSRQKRPTAFGDDNEGPVEEYLEGIRRTLAQRKIQLEDRDENKGKSDPTLPLMLVVVDLMDAVYDDDSPLNLERLEADAAISLLLEEGANLGAAVIFLVPERSKVPSHCQSVIEIERNVPATNSQKEQYERLFFRYAEVGVNTFRYIGEADAILQPEGMVAMAQRLTDLDLRQGYGASLTKAVLFLDLMEQQSLTTLREKVWHNWDASVIPNNANWLRCKIGRMSGNKARTLVFSAKRDGVHGMVAGSTGSGKSELLISMIAAMAVTYDPTVLNFVLVDYKGGGAFNDFKELPHCVDIITNLESSGVTRMFTAIQSEMQRRQKLNADTQTKNIVDYREKGLHLTHEPYPYLFIIIDEFAEMIADRPEFKGELESITRVGRAQGVSLILAAQRPTGVTDQMRSNIKFRICLRVETPAESREMLRRGDAAYLPSGIPGRGYLQVGNDEIELMQVAYTGERYVDPDQYTHEPVIWPDRSEAHDVAQDQEPPELYKAIITMLSELSLEKEVEKQRAPWPEFLPQQLYLSEVLTTQDIKTPAVTSEEYLDAGSIDKIMMGQVPDETLTLNPSVNKWVNAENGWIERLDWENYALRPVIGLIDNPYIAKQLPLIVDFPRGHVVVFGASGWGKTTLIRSMVLSLAATHSPRQAHMYLLDLGGRNLGMLKDLPHVGTVINPDEEGYKEQVEQLLRELDNVIEARKEILNDAGLTFAQYNNANPHTVLPGIVVAIDNFSEFRETFDSGTDNVESVLDRFVDLVRQSKPYGIHFIITVNQMNALSSQLYSLFTERLTLKLTDPTEYRSIVGGQVTDFGDIAGRGYIKLGSQTLSFQVAQPIDLRSKKEEKLLNETREIEQLARNIKQYIDVTMYQYPKPFSVEALPKSILFKTMLAREHGFEIDASFLERLKAKTNTLWQQSLDATRADWLQVTIGIISGNQPRQMYLEAKRDGVHGLIAGGTGSGKSELLMTLIVGLALRYDPDVLNFVLVDYKGGGAFKPFDNLPHVVDSITNLNKSAVKRMFTAINAEMQRRQKLNADTDTKDIVDYRKKGYHLSHEPYPHLFIIIDEYAEMISNNPEFKDELESITRVGRAQGVNLLLASQRPTGVTDQMRANIKFRICLRVEETDTSREMLRRSDAAYLPSGMPGRGYLQVGNENLELMQVAWTGEEYTFANVGEGERAPRFFDVVVNMTQQLLEAGQRSRPRTPWPPFLPPQLKLYDPDNPLVQEYLDPEYKLIMTLGRREQMQTLNPFIADWFNNKPAWKGINWGRTAMRGIVGLLDDPYNARQMPLVVNVTRGHVVLFGASGWGKTTFMRTLVVSLATTHSPAEFHAHILDLGGRNLEALKALPHVGTVIMPDERGYEERVQQILRELNDIVDARKKLFSEARVSTLYEYNTKFPDKIQPAVLVVIDNFAEFMETFGESAKKDSEDNLLEAFILLVRQAKTFGVHFVISVSRLNVLNNKLYSLFTERLALRLSDPSDYHGIVGTNVTELEELVGRGYTRVGRMPLEFQLAVSGGEFDENGQLSGESQQIWTLGDIMTKLGIWQGIEPLRIDALPKTSSFREVLTEQYNIDTTTPFIGGLKEAMQAAWTRQADPKHTDWLTGYLGITSGNRVRKLHFSAKTDGVHGLIAGGTGSGKSEMLMTLIIGLVVNHDPSILNFVLVDYKGGGAFKPFDKLPHVVDSITNLNKAAVNRMFTAINAEMRRRQKLNADTGTKDIVDYRKKGLHVEGEPYPHLFIIIDEYAEMIDDNPEYRAELESITRVGRAQGVNLLLASQRPKGVSDQMRANIKFRLCMRVEQVDTSREMLRRPDAAYLPNGMPGRGYLQIGNENLELIQVSYTGENQPDDRPALVEWPDRRPDETTVQSPANEELPKLFDAVVKLSAELNAYQMAPKPWPGFLPRFFSLQSPLEDAQHNRTYTLTTAVTDWLNGDTEGLWPGVNWRTAAMRPVVGLVDDPAEAKQYPLQFNLSRTHLVVMGDSGLGKTSLIRTLVVSLAATHGPHEFHAYILDMGGRNYRSLEQLPHVGAVIYTDEETFEERLQRLLDMLNRTIEERQQLLSNAGANTLTEYNERHPDSVLPAILVCIDNFAEMQENYEGMVENTLLPLVRRSLTVGISFVVTANVPRNLISKLYNLFGERITFKQSNADLYMEIVGRGAIEIDDIPGRGYIRVGRRPLLFHTALPVGILNDDGLDTLSEADEITRLAQSMQAHAAMQGDYGKPVPIDTLPEIVPLVHMLEQAGAVHPRRIQAVLGQSSNLQPAVIDLQRAGPHFVVVGPSLSGKTTLLYNWVLSLSYRYPPSMVRLILVDMQRKFADYGGNHSLGELPHVLATVSELSEMKALGGPLQEEAVAMEASDDNRALFVIIDNYDDFSEEVENDRNLGRDLALLARRYGRDGLHFIIAGALDGGISELRRRIQNSNYGVGLRAAQAVDTLLRGGRRPAALRDKELNIGRGFLVRSGQASMLQAASPYEGMGVAPSEVDLDDNEQQIIQALDLWVAQIKARYPGQAAQWSQAVPAELVNGQDGTPAVDPETKPIIDVLRRIAYQQNADRAIANWNDKDVLMEFVRSALMKELNLDATGLDVSTLYQTPEEVLIAAQEAFPAPDTDESKTNGTT